MHERLRGIDIWKKPERVERAAPAAPSPDVFVPPTRSGLAPRALSGVLLALVGDIQAIEALPDLLRLEEQLHRAVAAVEADAKAPVPKIGGDAAAMISTTRDEPRDKVQRRIDLLQCQVVERELLGAMTRLLRGERFAPMLATDFEQKRRDGLRQRAAKDDLAGIKSASDIPEERRKWIAFDEELGVPVSTGFVVKVPYSNELRAEIRGLAQKFLEAAPSEPGPEKRPAAPTAP